MGILSKQVKRVIFHIRRNNHLKALRTVKHKMVVDCPDTSLQQQAL